MTGHFSFRFAVLGRDIQSFSTFSEKLTAHQLVELLNEYLTAMTDILISERGTLDSLEGDAARKKPARIDTQSDYPEHLIRGPAV